MTTEIKALEEKFHGCDARIYSVLIELGIDPDAPSGSAKFKVNNCALAIQTGIDIFTDLTKALDIAISTIEGLVGQQTIQNDSYVPALLELKTMRGDFIEN